MINQRNSVLAACVLAAASLVLTLPQTHAQTTAGTQPSGTVQIGAIKSISGNSLVLTADGGSEIKVEVQEGARLLRIAPGQTSLKDATPITLQELQVADRIRIRGTPSADGKSLAAVSVIAMKKDDLAQRDQKTLQDWQRRGIGGPVKVVSPADGTVAISVMNGSGPKTVTVKTSKTTVVRRYSSESIKFEEAKPAKLEDIKVGDQLRARGDKNADGTEVVAEEILAGTFRNVAGLITAVDAAKGTLTVNDLATKKPVVIKVTADSQLRKLPAMAAQFLAMRLKGQAPAANGAHATPAAPAAQQAAPAHAGPGNGQRPAGDLNQMLGRIPNSAIGDFAKGEAVMVVTTQGNGSEVTAITLLGGVEALLTASPNGNMDFLSPWNLGGGSAEGAQ
jgi:hypothetical protein